MKLMSEMYTGHDSDDAQCLAWMRGHIEREADARGVTILDGTWTLDREAHESGGTVLRLRVETDKES